MFIYWKIHHITTTHQLVDLTSADDRRPVARRVARSLLDGPPPWEFGKRPKEMLSGALGFEADAIAHLPEITCAVQGLQ